MPKKKFHFFASDYYRETDKFPYVQLTIQLIVVIAALIYLVIHFTGCEYRSEEPTSASGIKPITAKVQTNAEGVTVEQQNIRDRLLMDNKPGSIKHLYIISAYSGQVLIYSTVRGKVTSSGKRLQPTRIVVGASGEWRRPGFFFKKTEGRDMITDEVPQDDGSYGSSIPYLYWWDAAGRYHQHYISGGQILHISDQPVPVKNVQINMTLTTKE